MRAGRRRLLGRRRGRGVEGHGGLLLGVAVLALDEVGVGDSVGAAAGTRGEGSTPRRQQRVVCTGSRRGREERI